MNLKAFIGAQVTVVLKPTVMVPHLEYFASVAPAQGSTKPRHLLVPADLAVRPEAAMAPQANVVPNCTVMPAEQGKPNEYDLVYAPWLPAEKRGPIMALRVSEDDVSAVMVCVEPPPAGELAELVEAERARRAAEAAEAPATPWQTPAPASPPITLSGFQPAVGEKSSDLSQLVYPPARR